MLSDPKSVMDSPIGFAASIGLGQHLLALYGRVRHMPSWYASHAPYPGQIKPWSSKVIAREAIADVKPRELSAYGIQSNDGRDDDDNEAFVLKFSASGKGYVFCARCDAVPEWVDRIGGNPAWRLSAFRAYVVELPAYLVLETRVVYVGGDRDVYHSDHMESFRPGAWLPALLNLSEAREVEAEADLSRFAKQFEADREKKFTQARRGA
jgi:hypothetical protein